MLDPRLIRERPEIVRQGLTKRGTQFDLGAVATLDERRRDLIKQSEAMKSDRNKTSDEIAKLRKAGSDATDKIERLRELGKTIETLEKELKEVEAQWENLLLVIPNMPHESVPVGSARRTTRSYGCGREAFVRVCTAGALGPG